MEDVIKVAVSEALLTLVLPEVDFSIEHPGDLSHGDFACNVALVLSKAVGQTPRAIAEQIVAKLEGQIEYIERIEIAGPGFINFYLTRDFFVAETRRILKAGDDWGRNDSAKGEEVLIEYTSPNLFKPLHVGNLVGNIIGESLTRLFEFSGAKVKRLNYPSDIGLTVAKGVWGLRETKGNPQDIQALGEAYRFGNEAYENNETKKAEIVAVNQSLYAGTDEQLNELRDQGINTSKERLLAICVSLGTTFDRTIFESEAAPKGIEIVQEHTPGVFKESEGAFVYEGEKVGLHTRVFLNSKGLPTYEAKDLGNFAIKQNYFPDWTRSIVVTGNEQTEYFKVIYAAIKEVFPEVIRESKKLEHIPTGFLTLTTGKMSSRKGNTLSGEQVLAELEAEAKLRISDDTKDDESEMSLATKIATAAIKFQILRQSSGSDIVFDKEKALSFEGDSGPYLQYTYARICSVLDKALQVGVVPSLSVVPTEPYLIEKILYRFEEVVLQALDERAPHKVVGYLTEIAGAFNTFYAHEKIADVTDSYAPYKCLLAQSVAQTLKNGLFILAIKAPERI